MIIFSYEQTSDALRDTLFKKEDDQKSHLTKVASNSAKIERGAGNGHPHMDFISDFPLTTYFLKYLCLKNELARFSHRISLHSRWANSLSGTESVQQNECIFRKNGNNKKFRSYRDLFDHVNNGGINGGGGRQEFAKLSLHCLTMYVCTLNILSMIL